jgi:hypothetical protein
LDYDQVQRELKVTQMPAGIENKNADRAYTQGLPQFEPRNVTATAATATVTVVGVLGGVLRYLIGRRH